MSIVLLVIIIIILTPMPARSFKWFTGRSSTDIGLLGRSNKVGRLATIKRFWIKFFATVSGERILVILASAKSVYFFRFPEKIIFDQLTQPT